MLSANDRSKKSYLYWVGKKSHADIFKDGYVGFTSFTPQKRWNEHISDAKKGSAYPIHKAIRKYGSYGLTFKVICIGSADYCLALEKKLRPSRGLGWNIAIGGEAPGLGKTLTDEHKHAVSIAQKGRVRTSQERINVGLASMGRVPSSDSRKKMSDAAKARGFSEDHKRNISAAKKGIPSTNGAWLHPSAIVEKWIVANQYFDLYNHGFGRIPASEMLGFKGDAFKSILNKIKFGWNPYYDAEYCAWKNKMEDM